MTTNHEDNERLCSLLPKRS